MSISAISFNGLPTAINSPSPDMLISAPKLIIVAESSIGVIVCLYVKCPPLCLYTTTFWLSSLYLLVNTRLTPFVSTSNVFANLIKLLWSNVESPCNSIPLSLGTYPKKSVCVSCNSHRLGCQAFALMFVFALYNWLPNTTNSSFK